MRSCLADSTVGPKLATAFQSCGIPQSRFLVGSLIGAIQNRCPSTMELTLKFGIKYRTQFCVFQSIGWLDAQGKTLYTIWTLILLNILILGQMIMDVIDPDMATLPASVQTALSDASLQTCVTGFVSQTLAKPDNQRCFPSYSAEDQQAIQGLAVGAGHIECFSDLLEQACTAYVGC